MLWLTPKELKLLEQKYKAAFGSASEMWTHISSLLMRLGSAYTQMAKASAHIPLALTETEVRVAVSIVSSFDTIQSELVGEGLLAKCYDALLKLDTIAIINPVIEMLKSMDKEDITQSVVSVELENFE